MTEILVVGFPKSGNTWLSRLLSAALDWPVRGIDDARPLAQQGRDHPDGHVIRQLHLTPQRLGAGIPVVTSQYTLNMDTLNGQHQIVHIIRDPRDVSVAIDHYWGIRDMLHTIRDVMGRGAHPLWGCSWAEFIGAWRTATIPVIETRYEWLHADTSLELRRVIDRCGLRAANPIGAVVARESIESRRALIQAAKDDDLTHGKGAQLANLRAGRVGDWHDEFMPECIAAARELFTPQLISLGYEDNAEWRFPPVQTC